MNDAELIYDWNKVGRIQFDTRRKVTLDDETLRDGLQNPSVIDPPIGEKVAILHLMEALGIEMVNIGLPGAGPLAYADTEALAKEIARSNMKIRPNCAARTHENDIRPIVEISQRAGIAIEASTFLGSSPIRRLVEDWTTDHLQRTVEHAVSFAVRHSLAAMFVTEDTVRTDPETIERLYSTAIRCGVMRRPAFRGLSRSRLRPRLQTRPGSGVSPETRNRTPFQGRSSGPHCPSIGTGTVIGVSPSRIRSQPFWPERIRCTRPQIRWENAWATRPWSLCWLISDYSV